MGQQSKFKSQCSRYSHCFCKLRAQTNFIKEIKPIVQAIPCLQLGRLAQKLYTLFRTKSDKNHTLSSGTSPYTPYMGEPPRVMVGHLAKVACEQALRGAQAPRREREGEIATTSLEFEFHLQFRYPLWLPVD